MNPRRAAKITLKSSKGLAHDRAIQTSVTKTQESKIFIKVVQPLSPRGRRGWGTLGISGWGCAAGTLEPLTYTRALDPNALIYIPYPRVNCLNTIPFTAAHTYIAHIWHYEIRQHIALQPAQIRATKNKRLTKTLLFVSVIAVTSWLPLVINNYLIIFQKLTFRRSYLVNGIVVILNYSNSFLNPVVYALRIPEFRQSLFSCCSRRQTVTKREGFELEPKGRVNMAAVLSPAMQLRTLSTNLSQSPTASIGPEPCDQVH